MRCFADTNVLVAVVTKDDDRADAAIAVLNDHEMHTSVLNLMELRSVLAKKKQFDREHVEGIEARITNRATITFPDASDIVAANRLQRETYLYPMDALILAAADAADATLLSFDAELREHGAKSPEEIR
ncbi:PIN domain-containing protein [Halococcus sp. PRR34]|uniref:PIN domain-containing protein n=1 Tax=Halococcus sp. PRR34 TaxID=3020830 RepID=UPI002361B1EE|nr:PIN domain-containing protein [Halococcus sp. PRR34]